MAPHPEFAVNDRVVNKDDNIAGTILRPVGNTFDGRWFVQWDDNQKEQWFFESELKKE